MVDTKAGNFDDTELMDLFSEVDRIIHTSDSRNILLVGDLNCYFEKNTPLVNIVCQYITDKGFHIFWSLPDESENHKIEEVRSTYTSTINGI